MFGILYYRASEGYLNSLELEKIMDVVAFLKRVFSKDRPQSLRPVYAALQKDDALKEKIMRASVFCESGWPSITRAFFMNAFAKHPNRKKIYPIMVRHGFDVVIVGTGTPLAARSRELQNALLSVVGLQAQLPLRNTKLWPIMDSYVVFFKQQLLRSLLDFYADLQNEKLVTQGQIQAGMEGIQAALHNDFLNLSQIVQIIREKEEAKH
jgi:hypothetical protein